MYMIFKQIAGNIFKRVKTYFFAHIFIVLIIAM